MEFSQRNTRRTVISFGLVGLLHLAVVYVVVSGLGSQAIDLLLDPIQTKIIEQPRQEMRDEPPPPPKIDELPPPVLPAPDVSVNIPTEASANAITSPAAAPAAPPPPPPVAAHVPVIVPAIVDPVHACRGKPTYPDASRRQHEEGTTIVKFFIAEDGEVQQPQIAQSSGYPRLDQAAVAGIATLCRFKPGTVDGKFNRTSVVVRYVWKLQ
jgi:protein TonB